MYMMAMTCDFLCAGQLNLEGAFLPLNPIRSMFDDSTIPIKPLTTEEIIDKAQTTASSSKQITSGRLLTYVARRTRYPTCRKPRVHPCSGDGGSSNDVAGGHNQLGDRSPVVKRNDGHEVFRVPCPVLRSSFVVERFMSVSWHS